jgi:hypothetical protein
MGYNNGNNPTSMGANGLKVSKILTFRPSKKEWNLTFLANREQEEYFKGEIN